MDIEKKKSLSSGRRSFLTKATAGVVLASIPARSVWASGFNTGSIVASSHASSWVGETPISLGSHGFWKKSSRLTAYGDRYTKFKDCFGATSSPIGLSSAGDTLIYDILNGESSALSGPGNVNCHMVAMYLNAKHSVLGGDVYYPVTSAGHFGSLTEFADHLYDNAVMYGGSYGDALSQVICEYNRDPGDGCDW